MNRVPMVFAVIAVAAVACSNASKDVPKAGGGPSSARTGQEGAPSSGKAVVYALDPTNTKIEFTGSKVTGSHDGSFTRFKGTVSVPEGNLQSARIDLEIDMDSLVVEPEKLAGHLRSPDFFDVAKFPKATYQSWGMMPHAAPAPATDLIQGKLTLKGVEKEAFLPATVTVTPTRLLASAKFSINRKDYGIFYAGMADDLIRDDVVIRLTVDAPAVP